jgi:hypothetical protein
MSMVKYLKKKKRDRQNNDKPGNKMKHFTITTGIA